MDSLEAWLEEFYRLAGVEGIDLPEFVRQGLAGRFGPADPALLLALIDEVERIVQANIESRLEEAPGLAGDAEAVWEAERARCNAAREMVWRVFPPR